MSELEILQKPDPKLSARDIDKRVVVALKALETTNKGKYAERTGVSSKTLTRPNTR